MKLKDFGEIEFPMENYLEKNIEIIYEQLKAMRYIVEYVYFKQLFNSEYTIREIKEHREYLDIESQRLITHLEFFITLRLKHISFSSFSVKDYFNDFYSEYYCHALESMGDVEFDRGVVNVAIVSSELRRELENKLDAFVESKKVSHISR